MKTPAHTAVSPLDAAKAVTPRWMQNIREFDALEIHPCTVISNDSMENPIVEQCAPEDANFWCVFGHLRTAASMTSRISRPKLKPSLFTTV